MYMDISMDPKKVILNELIHIIENIAFDKCLVLQHFLVPNKP